LTVETAREEGAVGAATAEALEIYVSPSSVREDA